MSTFIGLRNIILTYLALLGVGMFFACPSSNGPAPTPEPTPIPTPEPTPEPEPEPDRDGDLCDLTGGFPDSSDGTGWWWEAIPNPDIPPPATDTDLRTPWSHGGLERGKPIEITWRDEGKSEAGDLFADGTYRLPSALSGGATPCVVPDNWSLMPISFQYDGTRYSTEVTNPRLEWDMELTDTGATVTIDADCPGTGRIVAVLECSGE
jgi:hypothetical protein